MTLSVASVPLCVIGAVGLFRIPLDVISSPASNVAIAMGIDSMIHMVNLYRRKKGKNNISNEKIWKLIRDEMWQPILTAMLIIVMGFSIFLFSTFPPTKRFGTAIVFGTILSALISMYIMPFFANFKLSLRNFRRLNT
jgi:predicted RND superfamily exporter protein